MVSYVHIARQQDAGDVGLLTLAKKRDQITACHSPVQMKVCKYQVYVSGISVQF